MFVTLKIEVEDHGCNQNLNVAGFVSFYIIAMMYKNLDIYINRLMPNDPYMGRTTPLTSKRCILYIYSTNIGTEYFKHALYSPFFSLHNANLFGSCIIHILYRGCAKI